MTHIKADIKAADRVLDRATKKAVAMIRDGAAPVEYRAVLVASVVAADVLLEDRK